MKKFLSSFYLKLIAIISMTFDHVGKMLLLFYPRNELIQSIESVFSIIGRLAFPIFLFLIIEGFYHTKDIKKYFLRIGGMATLMLIGFLSIAFIPDLKGTNNLINYGNIFIDLFVALSFLYLINNENKHIKLLSLIPITYSLIFLLIQSDIIIISNGNILKALAGFAPQYSFVTPLILVMYALLTAFRNYYFMKKIGNEITTSNIFRIETFDSRSNVFSMVVAFLTIIMTLLTFATGLNLNTNFVFNTYFVFAIIPIMLYNGNLGFNNKIIKSAYYLYYPLSLCIIYLIVYLTTIIW